MTHSLLLRSWRYCVLRGAGDGAQGEFDGLEEGGEERQENLQVERPLC